MLNPRPRRLFEISSAVEWQRVLPGLLLLGLLTSGGCSFVGSDSDSQSLKSLVENNAEKKSKPPSANDGQKVRWDGGGVILGEADNLAFTPPQLRHTLAKMIAESKTASARALVQQFPDVTLSLLQQMDPATQELEALELAAAEFDRLYLRDGSAGWSNTFGLSTSKDPAIERTTQLRHQFWDALKKFEPQQALQLGLVKASKRGGGRMLQAECYRLEAIAYMMNDQPGEAVRSLKAALNIIGSDQPLFGSNLRLLLGEFYRHDKRLDLWKSTWKQAVIERSALLAKTGVHDPQFWNRAAYLRPAKTEWPAEAIAHHHRFLADYGIQPVQAEATIWCSAGYQHLLRGEGQIAVLAFKKAEAVEIDPARKTHLQLQQARAMVLAGQPGPASAILMRLIQRYEVGEDPHQISDRCKAILGSLKLQNGGVLQGLKLIQSAVESIETWPQDERLRAQADYALALLMRGQEQKGISTLQFVHEQFLAANRWHQAEQCLWNIAKYFEKTEQKERYREALRELTQFQKG